VGKWKGARGKRNEREEAIRSTKDQCPKKGRGLLIEVGGRNQGWKKSWHRGPSPNQLERQGTLRGTGNIGTGVIVGSRKKRGGRSGQKKGNGIERLCRA